MTSLTTPNNSKKNEKLKFQHHNSKSGSKSNSIKIPGFTYIIEFAEEIIKEVWIEHF